MLLNSLNRNMFQPFILIEVCSVDILVTCLRLSTGFRWDSFREMPARRLLCSLVWRIPTGLSWERPPLLNPWVYPGRAIPSGALASTEKSPEDAADKLMLAITLCFQLGPAHSEGRKRLEPTLLRRLPPSDFFLVLDLLPHFSFHMRS